MFGQRRVQVRSLEKRAAALEARVHVLEASLSAVERRLPEIPTFAVPEPRPYRFGGHTSDLDTYLDNRRDDHR